MKKTIYYLLCISMSIMVVFFNYKYFKSITEIKEKKIINEKIKDIKDTKTSVELQISPLEKYRIELNNNDVVGKITIKSLDIDSLIMQSDNNTFYLTHIENKEKNNLGSIMLDFRSDLIENKINIIYGHSSTYYNTPFSKLESYDNYEFYMSNRIIEITTNQGIDKYEIFSVMKLDKRSTEHAKVTFTNNEEYLTHLKWLKDQSIHKSEIKLDYDDKVLLIQTCSQIDQSKFYILVLRKDKII